MQAIFLPENILFETNEYNYRLKSKKINIKTDEVLFYFAKSHKKHNMMGCSDIKIIENISTTFDELYKKLKEKAA